MPFDGRAVANFALDKCAERGADVSNLSLQKIVYFCHAWSLIGLKAPLVGQDFEAWEYRLVLPRLYRESPVRRRGTRSDPLTGGREVVQYDLDSAASFPAPRGYFLDLRPFFWGGRNERNGMRALRQRAKLMDTRTPEQRRHIMQSVKTKNTGPEMVVRRLLHRLGFRYRLHAKKLPGRPDIVFPGRRKAIFIHGCYWHGHSCAKGRLPKSRLEYWGPKIERNKSRDMSNIGKLTREGWTSMVVWQCQIKDIEALQKRLVTFLKEQKFRSTFDSGYVRQLQSNQREVRWRGR